jgi:hypothetical protein
MWFEIGLAIGIPSTGVLIAYARYAWKKSLCFTALENRVKNMKDHEDRLDNIEKRQAKNEIYLKLLLDHSKIPYNP